MAAWGIGSVLVPVLIALGGVSAALIGIGALAPLLVLARHRPLLRVDAAGTVPVVAIARDAFVTAVTGHAECSRQAVAIVDERLAQRGRAPA